MTNKHSQCRWWWLKCIRLLFMRLLSMFGTDRVQGRTGPLILSLGRPRCSSTGQCQVWFICRGNAQPLYVQLIHQTKKEHFKNAFFFARLGNWGLSENGFLIDHNHIFSYMCFKGPGTWCLVRYTQDVFLSQLMHTSEDIIYHLKVKSDILFQGASLKWRKS